MIDNTLFWRYVNGFFLKFLNNKDALKVMGEVHEGLCGAHQSGNNMKRMINQYGYYWPTVTEECFRYAKGCVECQKHGNIQ